MNENRIRLAWSQIYVLHTEALFILLFIHQEHLNSQLSIMYLMIDLWCKGYQGTSGHDDVLYLNYILVFYGGVSLLLFGLWYVPMCVYVYVCPHVSMCVFRLCLEDDGGHYSPCWHGRDIKFIIILLPQPLSKSHIKFGCWCISYYLYAPVWKPSVIIKSQSVAIEKIYIILCWVPRKCFLTAQWD